MAQTRLTALAIGESWVDYLNRQQQHLRDIVEHLRQHKFPKESLQITFEFKVREPRSERELRVARENGKCLVLVFSAPGWKEETTLAIWREDEMASENAARWLEYTKLGTLVELLCHVFEVYSGNFHSDGFPEDYVPELILPYSFRPLHRGSGKFYQAITDEQRKALSLAYPGALDHFSEADRLYDGNPAAALRYAQEEGIDPELLRDFQKRGTGKCKPYRLAHYLAAQRAGFPIRHNSDGKRKNDLVSLDTLEDQRRQGDILLGIKRRLPSKRKASRTKKRTARNAKRPTSIPPTIRKSN